MHKWNSRFVFRVFHLCVYVKCTSLYIQICLQPDDLRAYHGKAKVNCPATSSCISVTFTIRSQHNTHTCVSVSSSMFPYIHVGRADHASLIEVYHFFCEVNLKRLHCCGMSLRVRKCWASRWEFSFHIVVRLSRFINLNMEALADVYLNILKLHNKRNGSN